MFTRFKLRYKDNSLGFVQHKINHCDTLLATGQWRSCPCPRRTWRLLWQGGHWRAGILLSQLFPQEFQQLICFNCRTWASMVTPIVRYVNRQHISRWPLQPPLSLIVLSLWAPDPLPNNWEYRPPQGYIWKIFCSIVKVIVVIIIYGVHH